MKQCELFLTANVTFYALSLFISLYLHFYHRSSKESPYHYVNTEVLTKTLQKGRTCCKKVDAIRLTKIQMPLRLKNRRRSIDINCSIAKNAHAANLTRVCVYF